MTRREKGLLAAVVVLAVALLLMGGLIMTRGLQSPHHHSAAAGFDLAGSLGVASFNGEIITDKEWIEELKRANGQEILRQMLNRKAVSAEAKAQGIQITPEEVTQELETEIKGYDSEEAYYQEMQTQLGLTKEDIKEDIMYRMMLEKIATANIHISDQEISEYLEQHQDQFTPKKQYQLSLIKLGSASEVNQVLDRLEEGEDFARLAQELSLDEYSRTLGGDLGWVQEDDPFVPEELLKAATGLKAGDIAGPIDLQDGYAIVQVKNIVEGKRRGDQEIRDEVRRQLALNEAEPLSELEQSLRNKYHAKILTTPVT